jgi:hypothetical protein
MQRSKSKRTTKRAQARNNSSRLSRVERSLFVEQRQQLVQVGGSVSTTPSVIELTSMGTGDTDGTREGLRIAAHKLDICVDVTNADSPANIIRMIVYVDKTNNGTGTGGLAASQLLADASTYPWMSPVNRLYTRGPAARYRVLHDVIFNPGATWQPVQRRKFTLNLRGMELLYQSTSATSSLTNGIFVFLVSDSSVSTHPAYIVSASLTFTP